jgi:hypothetical protein
MAKSWAEECAERWHMDSLMAIREAIRKCLDTALYTNPEGSGREVRGAISAQIAALLQESKPPVIPGP